MRLDFDDRASLDTSQVQDNRGGGGALGGRGIAIGGGGGLIGIIVLVISLLANGGDGGTGALSGAAGRTGSATGAQSDLRQRCQTGADADRDQDCRVVGIVNNVQAFWQRTFTASNRSYAPSDTRLFTGSTSAAAARPARSARSTARQTTPSTSTWASSTRSVRRTAPLGETSRSRTCSRPSTPTTCRTCSAPAPAPDARRRRKARKAPRCTWLQADHYAGVWVAGARAGGTLTLTEPDITDGLSDLATGSPGSCDAFTGTVRAASAHMPAPSDTTQPS